jgi:hypothetical protein
VLEVVYEEEEAEVVEEAPVVCSAYAPLAVAHVGGRLWR